MSDINISDASSIASIVQPANVMCAVRADWEEHVASRPTQATATMGDG